jgi:hypothetical protein
MHDLHTQNNVWAAAAYQNIELLCINQPRSLYTAMDPTTIFTVQKDIYNLALPCLYDTDVVNALVVPWHVKLLGVHPEYAYV